MPLVCAVVNHPTRIRTGTGITLAFAFAHILRTDQSIVFNATNDPAQGDPFLPESAIAKQLAN
jgi:hypothetical protein